MEIYQELFFLNILLKKSIGEEVAGGEFLFKSSFLIHIFVQDSVLNLLEEARIQVAASSLKYS